MFLGEIFLITKPPLTPIKKATDLPKPVKAEPKLNIMRFG